MKIKTKYCGIIYIFIILFTISILGLSFHLHTLTSKSITNIVKYRNELEMVSQLELALDRILMPANDYLIHGNEEERDIFEDLDADVNKYFSMLEGKYFPTHLMTEEREYINELKDQYTQVKAFSGKIFNLPDPIGNVEGAHLMEEMDLLAENMLEDMKQLHRRSRLNVLVETESIEAHFSRYMIIVLSVLGVAIIVSFFYGIFLTKCIIIPIGRLVEYMGFVAKGDFSKRLYLKTKDEIGFLCNSFNMMANDLQNTTVSKNYVDNIIKSMTDTLVVVTPDGIIQTVNQAARNLLGYREEQLVGQPIDMIFTKDTIFKETRNGELIIKVSVTGMEKTYISKDGRKIPVLFSASIMNDNEGKIQGIVCVAQDITEHNRMENVIKESEAKYRQVHATSFDGIIIADTEDRIIEVNKRAEQIFGYKPGELIGCKLIEIMPEHFREQHRTGMKSFLETGEIKIQGRILELEGLHKNGDVFPIELTVNSFFVNENTYFTGTLRDITERKRAEDELKKSCHDLEETQKANLKIMKDLERHRNELDSSLKEKEMLLREIHHRVKNNMQVVSSLLKLQMGSVEDKQFIEMLKESQNRVMAMSLIHEKLYQTKDLASVNFGDYVKSLVNDLFRSYKVNVNNISLKMDFDAIPLGIDIAIPCGLVINELVSNCLKYAFPEGRNGELKISLHRIADCGMRNADLKSEVRNPKSEIELIVSDNGVGIPEDIDYINTESLGLRLIVNLTEHQLKGKVELNRDKGTEFRIRFKEILYKKRL